MARMREGPNHPGPGDATKSVTVPKMRRVGLGLGLAFLMAAWLVLGPLVATGVGTAVLGRPLSRGLFLLGNAGLFALEVAWVISGGIGVWRAWRRWGRRAPLRRGFTLLQGMVVLLLLVSGIGLAIPAFLGPPNREAAWARESLADALSPAKGIYTDTGNYADVTPARLNAADPSLDYVAEAVSSTDPTVVSVRPRSQHEIVMVARFPSGRCFAVSQRGAGGWISFASSLEDPCSAEEILDWWRHSVHQSRLEDLARRLDCREVEHIKPEAGAEDEAFCKLDGNDVHLTTFRSEEERNAWARLVVQSGEREAAMGSGWAARTSSRELLQRVGRELGGEVTP